MHLTIRKSFFILAVLVISVEIVLAQGDSYEIKEYKVPRGTRPHDIAPAPDGTVWYTAQATEARR